jgi:hypothetical protein
VANIGSYPQQVKGDQVKIGTQPLSLQIFSAMAASGFKLESYVTQSERLFV